MKKRLWEKCAEFHGHGCGGLTIGYKAALYVIELMGVQQDVDGKAYCLDCFTERE